MNCLTTNLVKSSIIMAAATINPIVLLPPVSFEEILPTLTFEEVGEYLELLQFEIELNLLQFNPLPENDNDSGIDVTFDEIDVITF